MSFDSAILAENACQWLHRFLDDFSFASVSSPRANPAALSCGVLSLHLLRKLEETSDAKKDHYTSHLQKCQDSSSGYFLEPQRADDDADDSKAEYLRERSTFLGLLALQALNAKALHPLRFLDDWGNEGAISRLDRLWHSKAFRRGERIAHLLLFQIYRAETERQSDAAVSFHRILDWVVGLQAAKNGLWQLDDDADLDAAVTMAGHVLPFFEYVRRPILARTRALDTIIRLFECGSVPPKATSELALVSALAAVNHQLNCREEQIKLIFAQIRRSACQSQTTDGSFVDPEPPGNSESEGSSAGAIEATFVRLATLAIIDQTLSGQIACEQWRSPMWPGPGYHHAHLALTEHERKVLPLWIQSPAVAACNAKEKTCSQIPEISVVIPCFNLGRYLQEALESIFRQTYQDFELIIVDDGSTDEFTAWLLQNVQWPKTIVLRQANAGLAATRNRGIARASGRYICCLDPDDRLRPEFFAEAVRVLELEPGVGFISGFFEMFDERQDIFRYGSCEFPDLLAYNQSIQPAVFRRSLWEKAGGYCEIFSASGIEDWDLWISFIELGYRAHVIPEIVWEYRIRSDQMSTEMYEPDRWGGIFHELVRRHPQSYEKHAPAVLAKQAYRWAQIRAWANECQRAAEWWENNSSLWQFKAETTGRLVNDRQRWIDTLIVDKRWLEEQRVSWQQLAEEREKLLCEQQRWIDTLKEDKAWLEGERQTWQRVAEEREKTIDEQRLWIQDLEKAKAWLEEQSANWQALAQSVKQGSGEKS